MNKSLTLKFIFVLLFLTSNSFGQKDRSMLANFVYDTGYVFPPDTTPDIYRVLVEFYTGHMCGNSPIADNILFQNLKPYYGDLIVPLSIHAGYFAGTCPWTSACYTLISPPANAYLQDFTCTAGNDWNSLFSMTGYPVGMINRKDFPSTHNKYSSVWNSEIGSIINNVPQVKIRLHSTIDTVTRELKVYSETKLLSQITGSFNLNVILVEDSIYSWQLYYNHLPSEHDPSFIHKNVLRASLNGSFGIQLDTSLSTPAGTIFTNSYSMILPLNWNMNNVHAIAFVYNNSTKEILNVAEEYSGSIITEIGEIDLDNLISIYPNPSSSRIYIENKSGYSGFNLAVYDMMGRKIIGKKLDGFVDVENLEKGVYLIRIDNSKVQMVRRIVVD